MTTRPRTPTPLLGLAAAALGGLAAAGCAPEPPRLLGELAPEARSVLADAGAGSRVRCSRWIASDDWGAVMGCHATGTDSPQRFFYVARNGLVVSVGARRTVARDSLYAAVQHSAMELSHHYGLPGECREGSLRAFFWHAPTHHAAVLAPSDADQLQPRSPVDVVRIAGPLSCGGSVIYRSPAAIAS